MTAKNKKSIALVLSSGGSKGLAQIGVINELEREGFEITSISGSSIGSVIGGLYAMGKLKEYTDWVKTLDRRAVWGLLDFTVSKSGLLKGEKVFEKMKTFIPDVPIEDMNIPFSAVAADILNEKEVVFTSGSYYDAVRASISIPDIFTPVKYEDTILVDGGVLAPVPIEFVERHENDIVVVVNLYGDGNEAVSTPVKHEQSEKSVNILQSLRKLISSGDKRDIGFFTLFDVTTKAMIHRIAKQSIAYHKPEIVINIPSNSASTFDFHKADELIEIGENAARKSIDKYFKDNRYYFERRSS